MTEEISKGTISEKIPYPHLLLGIIWEYKTPGSGRVYYRAGRWRMNALRYWRHERKFYSLEECRCFLLAELEEITARTSRRSLRTRRRLRAERLAAIARDYPAAKRAGEDYRCLLCGRPLEDPLSISRALGAECWRELERAREAPAAQDPAPDPA
jgi:hypothetical protein